MTTTNSQLITDSLGLIGVLAETETMTAEQGAHGLRMLNQLLADWEQDGINLEYYEQVSLADETPVPDHAVLAVKYYLAFAVAPYYGRQVSAEMLALADRYYSRLVRDAAVANQRPADMTHLPDGTASGGAYNILTDR